MTRVTRVLAVVAVVVLMSMLDARTWAVASDGDERTSDHALFDGTNPLTEAPPGGARSSSVRGPGPFHVAVTAHSSGPAGFVRATFEDGDFVQFPVAAGGSFSFSQSIGGTRGVDRRIRISNGNDANGARLVGWVSVQGKRAFCGSCNFDDVTGAPDCLNNP